MATIGLSIESGAMNAVLFDSEADAVVASQVTSLKGGEATSLPTAVHAMQGIASRRGIDVDATALVYRSEKERDLFVTAIEESELDGIDLVSASSAFLGWLARSSEFESSECVLLYFLGSSGVSVSLADAKSESLTAPKTAVLDSMSPERIGGTVPLAWEVVDEADRKPTAVALFGDRSSSPDVVDILALGLGVPVVRVAESEEIAARGAALLAAGPARSISAVAAIEKSKVAEKPAITTRAPARPAFAKSAAAKRAAGKAAAVKNSGTQNGAVTTAVATTAVATAEVTKPSLVKSAVAKPALAESTSGQSDSGKSAPAKPTSATPIPVTRVAPATALAATSLAPVMASLPSVRPSSISLTDTPPLALAKRGPISRKKIVLSAALLAAVLSGGVALATVLPAGPPTQNEAKDVAPPEVTGVDTSLVGATQSVQVTQDPPPAVPAPPVVIDPVTQQPVVAGPPVQQWTIDPTTGVARPSSETLTPIPAAAIPPAAAVVPRQTVEPPAFAVPTFVPEPGKSDEQLQQEAWDRHWQHTAEWLEQEIVGN